MRKELLLKNIPIKGEIAFFKEADQFLHDRQVRNKKRRTTKGTDEIGGQQAALPSVLFPSDQQQQNGGA